MRNRCQRAPFSLDTHRVPNNYNRPIPLLCPVYLEKSCPEQKGIYEVHRFELQKQDFANGLGTCILYLRSYEA